MIIIGIVVNAFLLSAIMHFVAREEAEYSLPVMFLVATGLAAANLFLSMGFGLWSAPIMIGVTVCALHQFCYLRWRVAGLVTVIFIVSQMVLGVLLERFWSWAFS